MQEGIEEWYINCGHLTGPRLPHRDSDVGLAQRGGVIHPVTGHCDKLSSVLQGFDDGNFLGMGVRSCNVTSRDFCAHGRDSYTGFHD